MFCPHCGKEVAEDQMFCHHCGAQLRAEEAVHRASRPRPRAAGGSETAWEDRERTGFFKGLFGTLNEALFRPSRVLLEKCRSPAD